MNVALRTVAAIAAAFLVAQGALAEDCESEGTCGGPSGPPTLPSLPIEAVQKSATFRAYPSDGWNSTLIEGRSYYNSSANADYLAVFAQGAGVPFDDTTHTYGSGNSIATLRAFFQPDPTAIATAHQDSFDGRSEAAAGISYLVTLTTPNAATADAIQALMGSNAFATVQGSYTLSASGYAKSYAGASSTYGPSGDNSYSATAMCDDGSNIGGCGTHGFDINLGFQRGNQFADGNANYFYAVMNIWVEADAGLGNIGVYPGDASGFIDPTITLSNLLSPYSSNLTLNIGGFGPPAGANGVPEPASWALMLGGFGLVGGVLRRHRSSRVVFAL